MRLMTSRQTEYGPERPFALAIGRAIVAGNYGILLGIISAILFLLLAWGWSPRALTVGIAIFLSVYIMAVVSGFATGASRGVSILVRSVIGALIASPVFLIATTKGIPRLFESRMFYGESKKLVLVILKSPSLVHFVFAAIIGLIVGIIIARMKEDVYFILDR